jgi:Fe-S-cluster containining protein
MQAMVQDIIRSESSKISQGLRTSKDVKDAVSVVRFVSKKMDHALHEVYKPRLACENGCSYCCHYHVYASPLEVFALVENVKALDSAAQNLIQDRLTTNLEQITKLTLEEHIATNIRCALLGDDGKCVAYEARPLACRKHHSVDGIACKVTFDDPSSPMENTLVAAREAVSAGFVGALKWSANSIGLDTTRYELHGALHEALQNPASVKRWRQGKTAFPSVRDKE